MPFMPGHISDIGQVPTSNIAFKPFFFSKLKNKISPVNSHTHVNIWSHDILSSMPL